MRSRKLKIVVSLGAFKLPVAEVTIRKFARMLQPKTKLVCPNCGEELKGKTVYACPKCNATYHHWSQLKRVLPDGTEIVKPKLTTGETVEAQLYIMDKTEFATYVDAVADEYGLITKDSTSAENLKKLLIAITNLNKVCIIKFTDTYEQRIALLTLNLANRVILRELIPQNLLAVTDTMKVDLSGVTDKDIAEAEVFVKQLPHAEPELFKVEDYRVQGITKPETSPKVIQLEEIIAKAKQEKAIT